MVTEDIIFAESFTIGTSNLASYCNKLTKFSYGMLMFCESGEAVITIDLNEYHIVQNTNIFLLPGSIISVVSVSSDFVINYFVCSKDMFRAAFFRFESAFLHFMRDNPCYTPTEEEIIQSIHALIKVAASVFLDKENRFRNEIAQNLLQIFLWDTYDKVQRLFTPEQINGSNRKEELFKTFISLVNENCMTQRDVAWYAENMYISSRYLASIVRDITGQRTAKGIIDDFLTLELKVALQTTNFSIKEIADRFNFPDQSFLGRYFKKHVGVSPKQFRQQKESVSRSD